MDDKRTVKYFLAVSEPDLTEDFLFQAESDTPFGAMSEGDLFRMNNVAGSAKFRFPDHEKGGRSGG